MNKFANKENVSVKPETLQVYSFSNGSRKHDQLVMKTPQKWKEGVSNNFLYLLREKKQNRDKLEAYKEKKTTNSDIWDQTHNNNKREQNNT